MTPQERADQIAGMLSALNAAWPALMLEVNGRIDSLANELIGADNEQTRGRIKELRRLLNLPETLQQEREGIIAGLSENSDPAS